MTPSTPANEASDGVSDELEKLHAKFLVAYLEVYDAVAPSTAHNYIAESKLCDLVTQFMNQAMSLIHHHDQRIIAEAERRARIDELALFTIALASSNGGSDADKVHAVRRYFADRLAALTAQQDGQGEQK